MNEPFSNIDINCSPTALGTYYCYCCIISEINLILFYD